MDEPDQQTGNENPSYWNSVAIAGALFGFISFLIPLILGYVVIGTESTDSISSLVLFFLGICFACLVGAMGGFTAVWHYVRTNIPTISLGNAALIGFLTGVGIVLVDMICNQVWSLIDPDYMVRLRDGIIAMIENLDLPEAQKQAQIDAMAGQFQPSKSFSSEFMSFLTQAPISGILNLVTGMIGAKIFGDE